MGALSLYLNFINLFMLMLRVAGVRFAPGTGRPHKDAIALQPTLDDCSAGSSQIAGRDGPCASVSKTAASAATALSGRAFS
jgi:hypothetical protein